MEIKVQTLKEQKIKKGLFMAAMMGPAIVGFLVFYVYINFDSLIMAFQEPIFDPLTNITSYSMGFGNFALFFKQVTTPGSVFAEAVANTGIFFLLGFVNILTSLIVGYFIYKKIVGYKFFRFIYYLPCFKRLKMAGSQIYFNSF